MNYMIKRFESAAKCTGVRVRRALLNLPESVKESTCEIRLRCGRPIMINGLYGEAFITANGRESYIVTPSVMKASIADIEECFRIICGYSVHTHQNSICSGYVTVSGGHRAGITGTAVISADGISSVRDISSINIRIAKEFKGIADELYGHIKKNGWKSVILAGAPSSGKTTVLRDLARILASESGGYMKTVIIDEREEIAACCNGVPQNDIGISSDVLSGYPKGEGILTALRSMSPENIILDEIGTDKEVTAIETGLNSGVNFFLSVHAADINELFRRKHIVRLLNSNSFDAVVFLDGCKNPSKIVDYIAAGDIFDKVCGSSDDDAFDGIGRVLCSGNDKKKSGYS